MEFSSYGDLLNMLYHPQKNPQPVVLGISGQDSQIRNRLATPYDFAQLGEFAVYGNKQLLIEDQVRSERQSYDEELGVHLDRVVLRFDHRGQYLDYLGQDGLGGRPFPLIEEISTSGSDEMVVISKTPTDHLIHWFSSQGRLLHQARLNSDNIALPDDLPKNLHFSLLEKVVADVQQPRVYIQATIFDKVLDANTRTVQSIEVQETRLYTWDMIRGTMVGDFAIPRLRRGDSQTDSKLWELPYEFIGVAEGPRFFFLSALDQDEVRLMILNEKGSLVVERRLRVRGEELFTADFRVSPRGILTALLSNGTQVNIVLWRTDRLISIL